MKYYKEITLKDGRNCILRNGTEKDGEASLYIFKATHEETDWLLTCPEEIEYTAAEQAEYLSKKTASDDEIELIAEINGKPVALAGLDKIHNRIKTRHRVDLGISVLKEYWGLGIGARYLKCVLSFQKRQAMNSLSLRSFRII